ncbi:MAG: hypothetical protein IJQ55_01555 [Alphaproteobacteria bacterium]|nr:hypothetical protein [Alphaproteobacteria bacterium]
MRKICLILTGVFLCVGSASAAVRDANTVSRQSATRNDSTVVNRSAKKRTVVSRNTNTNSKNTARNAVSKSVVGRSAVQKTNTVSPSAGSKQRVARSTTTVKTKTFGENYNSCRDAYFTCMDQFCAAQNENYRRCVCSSKIKDIQKQEKLLSQTDTSLKDFESLNLDVISKSSNEVKAMISASAGESALKKDSSDSATALQNITTVLNNSKQQSLSTAGKLDIGGNIKDIWTTTNLIGGTDIANLSGEALFNAVHSQCEDLVKSSCESADFKMVASAYGMYIENDCAILENNLKNKINSANAAIRQTRHKMQDSRLENYNAHNSLTINNCIAKVRESLTADSVCGEDYIHCLDFSGKYLNASTGAPIYSPEFYQIEKQISLEGDILKNNQNTTFVSMLNKKRVFAEKNLDLCQDDADETWNEFLRQAIVEIYQSQQKIVQTVKTECLHVVNECYLKQSDSLKKFVTDNSQIGFVQTMELSEEMCEDKLNTCSNLYGGGSDGLATLVKTMKGVTDLTIEQSCPELLAKFATDICAVPASDITHSYPYGCRRYAPGESYYARRALCNQVLVNPFSRSDILTTQTSSNNYSSYISACRYYNKRYTSCKFGYYLYNATTGDVENYYYDADHATECHPCPFNEGQTCIGGTQAPQGINSELYETCGQYYVGSLYQQLVIYALQNCTRTTDNSYVLSEYLLSEVNKVAQSVKDALVPKLTTECSNLNGTWINSQWVDDDNNGHHDLTGDTLHRDFYINTGTNKLWGYCKE